METEAQGKEPKESVLTMKNFKEMRHHYEKVRRENKRIDNRLYRQFGKVKGPKVKFPPPTTDQLRTQVAEINLPATTSSSKLRPPGFPNRQLTEKNTKHNRKKKWQRPRRKKPEGNPKERKY